MVNFNKNLNLFFYILSCRIRVEILDSIGLMNNFYKIEEARKKA